MKKQNILFFSATGSGGHILPALVLARSYPDASILFFTTTSKLDKKVIENSSLSYVFCPRVQVPGKKIWRYPAFFIFAGFLFFKALAYSLYFRPQRMISTGGIDSLIISCAAFIAKVPVDVYELNAKPGIATRAIARFAANVFVVFSACKNYFSRECVEVNYPLRFEDKDRFIEKNGAIEKINNELLARNLPLFSSLVHTLFILGGSQGSQSINAAIGSWIEEKKTLENFQIIHQIGINDSFDWVNFYKTRAIAALTFSYRDDIALLYAAADTIVTRGGAGTLCEIEFFKKRCMIIPLKTARTDHQVHNAEEMVKRNRDLFTILSFDEPNYKEKLAHFLESKNR